MRTPELYGAETSFYLFIYLFFLNEDRYDILIHEKTNISIGPMRTIASA